MRAPSCLTNRVILRGEDAAAYRDRARRRDQIALRVVATLVVSGHMSRLLFDMHLIPDLQLEGILFRLSGIACFSILFVASFHRVTYGYLHLVVGVGYLLGSGFMAAAYAVAPWQGPLVNSTVGIALLLLAPFSFSLRYVALVGVVVVTISFVHMPLLGLGALSAGTRLFGSGIIAAITLLASWFFDQHWRRSFLVERDLARSHENLRHAHQELEDAHATLKDTQAQLVTVERSAALGRLVASLAHQINAPVGIQVSLASHLADTTENFARTMAGGAVRRADLAEFVETARESGSILLDNARRMANLVDALKQLEVGAEQEMGAVDMSDLLARNRPIIEAMMPPGVALVLDAPVGLRGLGAPNLLDVVLQQTVSNAARHAFPDCRAGAVTVRARPEPEGRVALIVADDGCGIAPEHLERVFDPFYTDGAIGGGAGLGLSIVHNAVVGPLGGQIAIDSRVGLGTTVTVRLSAAA
ncbi:ATP-binding protein [Azospirillum sp.]|uniref:sensor histidine kinase n=1 Tax=Azospirillum sp. TaxID=34012 RepID=UPI00263A1CD3|nr:ATP-binding protein [Azospirillum sp.]